MQRAKTWTRRKLHLTSKASGEVALFPSRVGSSAYLNPNPDPLCRGKVHIGESVAFKPKPTAEDTAYIDESPAFNADPPTETSKQSEIVVSVAAPEEAAAEPEALKHVSHSMNEREQGCDSLRNWAEERGWEDTREGEVNTRDYRPAVGDVLYINDVDTSVSQNQRGLGYGASWILSTKEDLRYICYCKRCEKEILTFPHQTRRDLPWRTNNQQPLECRTEETRCSTCDRVNPLRYERLDRQTAKLLAQEPVNEALRAQGKPTFDGLLAAVLQEGGFNQRTASVIKSALIGQVPATTPRPSEQNAKATPSCRNDAGDVEATPRAQPNGANDSVKSTPISQNPAPYAEVPPSSKAKLVTGSVTVEPLQEKTTAGDAPIQRAKA